MDKESVEKIIKDLEVTNLSDEQKELVATRFMQSYKKRLETITAAQVSHAGLVDELDCASSPEEINAVVRKALNTDDDGLLEQTEAMYDILINEFKSLM